MTIQETLTAFPAPAHAEARRNVRIGGFLLRALNWLAERDRLNRDAVKLKEMSQERLDDIGLSRGQADWNFYQRFGNRAADNLPIHFMTRW